MNALLTITAPVFLIVAFGYGCARAAFFQADAPKIFMRYIFYCTMPFYFFATMAKVPKTMIANADYIFAYAISMIGATALAWFVARVLARRDFTSCVLAGMSASGTNAIYIGTPIIVMAYGNPSAVVVLSLFQIVVATTAILTSIEIHKKHGILSWAALREFPSIVLCNPMIIGAATGILFALNEWAVPTTLDRASQLLGSAGIPTALFVLGLSLGEKRPRLTAKNRNLVYTLVGLKSFAHPALAWLAGRYLFGLSDQWLQPLTLIAAMPTAVNNFIFAHRYDSFVAESSQIIFLTSILSLFTLSGLLILFGIGG
jgi:predicted permease